MAKKGSPKNTKNKAKHSKLMARKTNKLRDDKIARENRLKEMVKKMHELKAKSNE
ncbi:hypothetical protein [Lutibacter citreus]|uniref:hypothetical protein n=1 Tax=Lutibacter citreus TaxID=2138210 RepID=UPI0015D09031|nr:hypothetical protein [Lutibacter citreus]